MVHEYHAGAALNQRLEVPAHVVGCEELPIKDAVSALCRGQRAAGKPEGTPSTPSHCSRDAPMPRSNASVQSASQAEGRGWDREQQEASADFAQVKASCRPSVHSMGAKEGRRSQAR